MLKVFFSLQLSWLKQYLRVFFSMNSIWLITMLRQNRLAIIINSIKLLYKWQYPSSSEMPESVLSINFLFFILFKNPCWGFLIILVQFTKIPPQTVASWFYLPKIISAIFLFRIFSLIYPDTNFSILIIVVIGWQITISFSWLEPD